MADALFFFVFALFALVWILSMLVCIAEASALAARTPSGGDLVLPFFNFFWFWPRVSGFDRSGLAESGQHRSWRMYILDPWEWEDLPL